MKARLILSSLSFTLILAFTVENVTENLASRLTVMRWGEKRWKCETKFTTTVNTSSLHCQWIAYDIQIKHRNLWYFVRHSDRFISVSGTEKLTELGLRFNKWLCWRENVKCNFHSGRRKYVFLSSFLSFYFYWFLYFLISSLFFLRCLTEDNCQVCRWTNMNV